MEDFVYKLDCLRNALTKWSKTEFKNSYKCISMLIDKLHIYMGKVWSREVEREVADIKKDLAI